MRVYRFTWGVLATVVVVSASVDDAVTGGLLRMAVLGPLLALLVGTLAFVLAEERPDRWTLVRRSALWCGAGAVGAGALAATWGSAGISVGVALALTSPTLVALLRAQFISWSSRRSAGPPETLATRDLRRRWEWTTAEVVHPRTSVPRRVVLAEERRRLLDELQRRDPEGFDDWILVAVPDRGSTRPPRGRRS